MSFHSFTDQTGHQIQLFQTPQRIVSLVPSQTELLADLGLEDRIVGITRYCVYPTHWRTQKAVVGGTKDFDPEIVKKLNPDLIIGNKEENEQSAIESLRNRYSVWLSDIDSLSDALSMISEIGAMTGRLAEAGNIISAIRDSFATMPSFKPGRVLYLIWRKPWMAAASGTFINSMLETIGLENCLKGMSRYLELSDEQIRSLNPDVIFLSSEPFPFREKHIQQIRTLCPDSKILLVDGEMFSWYGSRLLKAPAYFNSLPLD